MHDRLKSVIYLFRNLTQEWLVLFLY